MPSNKTAEFSSRIRDEAARLGFFKVGITAARQLTNSRRFTEWLGRGFNGEMRYMERQAAKRLDPSLVLEDARSVLVLALNYYAASAISRESLKGRISRYAWGRDYHATAKTRLEALLKFIKNLEPSAQGACYVDTGPIMEKAWGAQTSIGWMGKNTCLITRSHGSWFFIGAILLDIELKYDSKEKDFCGKCNRCIVACPTGAIVAPYMLDARLCISYLTIELRGVIPRPLRPLIGNHIFGCDDCQEACPWNRFAVETFHSELHPEKEWFDPDLASMAQVSSDEFVRRFKDRPVYRATRDGFVRNIMVALGNSTSCEAIPVLKKAMQDSSPLVRAHAAWALGRIADRSAFQILESFRAKENHPLVIEEIRLALESA